MIQELNDWGNRFTSWNGFLIWQKSLILPSGCIIISLNERLWSYLRDVIQYIVYYNINVHNI